MCALHDSTERWGRYMKKSFKAKDWILILAIALIPVLAFGFSWFVTCGVIKLITMCFGLTFKWKVATGIWLTIIVLKSIFTVTVTEKNK